MWTKFNGVTRLAQDLTARETGQNPALTDRLSNDRGNVRPPVAGTGSPALADPSGTSRPAAPPPAKAGPQTRAPNPVDFWRGLALVMIFINHIPGNVLSQFTLRNYSISDAAELFVFLAGYSLSYATLGSRGPATTPQIAAKLGTRVFDIYRAQILISVIALSILAGAAIILDNPLFLEWHNAQAAFYAPVDAIVGLVTLTYQIGYFNILPLYIVTLLFAIVLIPLARAQPGLALIVSFGGYILTLVTETNMPNWPVQGSWYFNPLAWQFLLMLGFFACELSRADHHNRNLFKSLQPVAIAGVIAGGIVTWFRIWPDPATVPEPRMLFLFEKTFLSPIRIVSLVCIVLAFQGVFGRLNALFPRVSAYLCGLGRNALPVFCVCSLLSLLGQVVRFIAEGSIAADLAVVAFGLTIMGLTKWICEQRSARPSGERAAKH